MTQPSNVLFREIHKNAWLKKLSTVEKRNGAFPKKGERVWVVFCVHDDTEALLELYMDQKLAVAHKPDWFVSLNNCLHVSPTICPQEDEYEFVITLSSEVIRLSAPSWDIMMEWVETIRSKLQEMRILSPRENVYSKMPEARLPLAPTRDPNSPLPPTPMGPSARVPGIEPVHTESTSIVISSETSEHTDTSTNGITYEIHSSSALYITQSEPPVYTRPRHVLNRAVSVPDSSSSYSSSLAASPGFRNPSSSNVTVIEVSSIIQPVPHSALPSNSEDIFNFNEIDVSLRSLENIDYQQELSHSFDENESIDPNIWSFSSRILQNNTPARDAGPHLSSFSSTSRIAETDQAAVIPGPSNAANSVNEDSNSVASNSSNGSNDANACEHEGTNSRCGATCRDYSLSNSLQDVRETFGHYECVFFPSQTLPSQESSVYTPANPARSRSNEMTSNPRSVVSSITSENHVHPFRTSSENHQLPSSEQPSTSASNSATVRQRSRSTSLSEGCGTRASTSTERNHNNSNSAQSRNETERRLQPAPHPYRYIGSHGGDNASPGRLTLREQQVLQLRREMLHPGGVRLQLRRKDCTSSIALVDAFGAVWIAGWKQKEHPMLYNALHIGDHLVSTSGILVQNASDAQKLIRGTSSLYVEFVIRRVPCGRVFAIRRDTEGQNLGIVQEGNTAEIRDVIPGSPAARHGLAPRAPTCDGLSLTNWILTEINGRPLNLFFKDGEVRDRLNAVGRDISILVQPADLVKQLKKQLKSIRGYKEYIVQ